MFSKLFPKRSEGGGDVTPTVSLHCLLSRNCLEKSLHQRLLRRQCIWSVSVFFIKAGSPTPLTHIDDRTAATWVHSATRRIRSCFPPISHPFPSKLASFTSPPKTTKIQTINRHGTENFRFPFSLGGKKLRNKNHFTRRKFKQ